MIVQLFNSGSVSGPERLVLPALMRFRKEFMIVNLREERIEGLGQSDPLEKYTQSLGLSFRAIEVRGRWDFRAIHELRRLLVELKPNLVHAHSVKSSIYLSRARPRGRSRCPIVSTHHGVHGNPDWKSKLYEWLYRKYFLNSFDRVLSVSRADYAFLNDFVDGPKRLRLHLNGIDGRFVRVEERPAEARRARALWLPNEARRDHLFLFGVVGRLSAEKDHARLFEVLAHLNHLEDRRDWRCMIFGVGALEAKLRRQAFRLGLDRRIVWMGYRDTLGAELAGLDILLSFSKAEGMPINVIEAGWSGTPAMVAPVGGLTELIPDGTYGIRLMPREPIDVSARRMGMLLSEDGPQLLRALGRRFQERVMREFTQEKWIGRLNEIYSEMNVRFSNTERMSAVR